MTREQRNRADENWDVRVPVRAGEHEVVVSFLKKTSALELLDVISKSCLLIWKGIIKFSPIAVFALFANLFGTITITQLDNLIVYLLLFIAASLVLTFWIVPGLISAFIDFPITRIIKEMREGIFMSAVPMLPVTSIPYVLQLVDKLEQDDDVQKVFHNLA